MKERLYFVESMRASLMVLVVVYHVAAIYKPNQTWLIYSETTSQVIGHIASVAYNLSMPGFFLISGYLAALSLKDSRPAIFLKLRFERIGIPVISTALVFNSIQGLILYSTGWKDFSVSEYLINGEYISHLWFLINLLCYFTLISIIALIIPYNRKINIALQEKLLRTLHTIPTFMLILLLSFISWCISISYRFGFPLFENYGGVIYMPHIMAYLPYFLFGTAIFITNLISKITTTNIFILIVFVALSCIPLDTITQQFNYGHIVSYFQPHLFRWTTVFLCLTFFYKNANKPYMVFKKTAESSFSIYLSHHLLVIIFGLAALALNMNIYLSFIIILTLVSITGYIFHSLVVNRSKTAKYLFNGIKL